MEYECKMDVRWIKSKCQGEPVRNREKQKMVGIKMENECQFSGNYVPCAGIKTKMNGIEVENELPLASVYAN